MSVGRKRAVPPALCRFARTRAITAAGMYTAILTLAAVLTFTPVATAAGTLATLIQSGDRDAEADIVDDKGASPLDIALGRAGSRDDRPSEEVAAVLERALNGGG